MYSTKSVWSLVAVVAVALFAVSLQAEDFQLHAQAIVADLAARNFDKIAAQFDATMAASVPPAKLATAWDSVVASAGPYKSIAGMRQQEQQTYQVVVATCQFERARWDVRVVMDSKGKVANWKMELGSLGMLTKYGGWTETTVKKGDHVTVQGFVAKDGSPYFSLGRIWLPSVRCSERKLVKSTPVCSPGINVNPSLPAPFGSSFARR